MKCPCGLKENYQSCCGLYIDQNQPTKTAEILMRSRYSAYAMNNIDYIIKTMRGSPLKGFSKKSALISNNQIKWLSLTIIQTTKTSVEFKAKYINQKGEIKELHENSRFKQRNGQWVYIGMA